MNTFVGRKVAIVSDKPQTTRRGVRAVLSTDDHQIVFTDTPGFHKPRTLLGSRLNDLVGEATQGVDAVVQVVDAQAGVGRGDAFVFERQLRDFAGPKICAVNKLDALRNREEVPQLEKAAALGDWDEVVPSRPRPAAGRRAARPAGRPAARGSGVLPGRHGHRSAARGPTGGDRPREGAGRDAAGGPALDRRVVEELEDSDTLTKIHASLIVERDSQKGIVIGKGGETLKTIGSRARQEIERVLGHQVFLDLHVKVLKEWQRDPKALQRLGF